MVPEPWYADILKSLLSVLVGAAVVYYFGIRHLTTQRRLGFLDRQLSEFYAPLAGFRKQIRAASEVREKVAALANDAWQDICRSYGDRPMVDHAARFAPFKKIIEYDNAQLQAELVPKYRQMLAIFTDRYHLADEDTRPYYQDLVEFVEIWNRTLADALPAEVIHKLQHREAKLREFYDHLETKMQRLQDEIARGGIRP